MKKIFDKAIKGGFIIFWQAFGDYEYGIEGIISDGHGDIQYEYIYLRHDFLKAFFGDNCVCSQCGEKLSAPRLEGIWTVKDFNCECHHAYDSISWIYHAQQLVLSTDRKEYLKRFI